MPEFGLMSVVRLDRPAGSSTRRALLTARAGRHRQVEPREPAPAQFRAVGTPDLPSQNCACRARARNIITKLYSRPGLVDGAGGDRDRNGGGTAPAGSMVAAGTARPPTAP